VRRPVAKRMPSSSRGRRRAERLCSQEARLVKVLVSNGGRCENGKVGSLTQGLLSKDHGVQGAGFCPTTRRRRQRKTRVLPLSSLTGEANRVSSYSVPMWELD
jgi:hypothetical protein